MVVVVVVVVQVVVLVVVPPGEGNKLTMITLLVARKVQVGVPAGRLEFKRRSETTEKAIKIITQLSSPRPPAAS